jgi:hypothetical protein
MTTARPRRDPPGTHSRFPLARSLYVTDVRMQKGEGADAASRDLQSLHARIAAAIAKWDGKLPQVAGGATPFINVGAAR